MAPSAPSAPPTHANPCAAEIAAAVAAVVDARPEDVKIDQPPNRALGDFAVPAFPLLKAAGGGAPPALAARDPPRCGLGDRAPEKRAVCFGRVGGGDRLAGKKRDLLATNRTVRFCST